jgi:hypothetical protein
MIRQTLRGALAGAAGTTALNAVTYADMAWRARPASSTPQETVERVAAAAHLDVPGEGEDRDNRVSAIGSLTGLVTGIGVGSAYGLLTSRRMPPTWAGVLVIAATALVAANGPMAALGVTDPRTWSTTDWVSDVVPHLGFGAVTALALSEMSRTR